jgi:hypothetical protein
LNGNPWERLSVYESRDLVSNLYLLRHGDIAPTPARKAPEITACLVQGRQFFAAAGLAGDLAQPLLLYYGVLALARGLILFLDPTLRLATLEHSHGVQERGWSDSLLAYGGGGAGAIPDLEIRLSGTGTFGQLVAATNNVERWRVFKGLVSPSEFRRASSGTIEVDSVRVTVREILERIPDLKILYEQTFLSSSQCHSSMVRVEDVNTYTDIEAIESSNGILDAVQLKQLLGLRINRTRTNIQRISEFGAEFTREQGFQAENVNVRRVRVEHSTEADLLPHLASVKNDQAGNIFLVSPLPGGIVLSSLSLLFLVSYVMGTLVRYYPTAWQSLIAREIGDITYPLLRAAMVLVRDEFPNMIVNELENVHPRFWRVT